MHFAKLCIAMYHFHEFLRIADELVFIEIGRSFDRNECCEGDYLSTKV